MGKNRILAILLAAAMLLPSSVTALAVDNTAKEPPLETSRIERLQGAGPAALEPEETIDPAEEITAIVRLTTEPQRVSSKNGGTEIRNTAAMLQEQKTVQNEISKKVLDGQSLEVLNSYTAAVNGFAIKVPYGKLDEIRALSKVAAAYPAPEFKVEPNMETKTTELGGLENSSGYQGQGMVIAIVDSGLEISHKLFRDAPESPALTQKDVENVLANKNLKAEDKKAGITASQVYHSAKVPFAFDYADNDLDVNPGNAGDHGVHVAGIAAGNQGVAADVVGVAPQAQILAMKVFSSSGSNGATWDDILAAADDAVALGADVINMSLGSTCGFSTPEGDEEVATVFENIASSGVMLSISAGNEYSAALGTRIGKGHALTANPDYGTVASPSSYSQPLSIASVEKADTIESCYLTVGDRKVAFNDTVEDKTASGVDDSSKSFRSLAGQELSYVVVPNAGETKDYDGLDVRGKIALVSRGSVEYNVKKEAAKAAGAAGILVYNNEPGMLYMQMDAYDLPSAFISQADGKALAALAENARKLTVSSAYGKVENPTSGEMSDFSSWGVTPELTLKPDITAPGGNIKSATVNNGYTTKSGTSMSAPFVSGAMAVTKQYVEQQNYAESETDKAELVSDLLMSTADLVMAGTAPYSPRKQGAGSVNIAAATSTKAYLTAEDGTRPKLALGDDKGKTGNYTLKFKVHNLSDETLTYTLGGYIQTDGQEVTKKLGDKDVHQVTELPYLLGKIDAQTVTVAGGATETVSVTVSLTQANKEYLNSFENGTYVEGFVTLTPQSTTQPTLSIPYMGFYGDWTQAPIVDAGDYSDLLNDKDSWAQAYVNTAASSSLEGTLNTYLGDNPYHEGVEYLSDRNAISPNGDDYMDTLSFVYTGLLRNVKALKYEIKDAETGEVYYNDTVNYETKSVYSSNYYQIVPSGASDYNKLSWDGTKKDGYSKVPNNTKAIVTITGELAYEAHAANNQKSSWSFPITIDTEEPEAKDITVRTENGKYFVDLTVKDNQFVSNVTISNNAESKELASFPVAETKAGAETKCSYDITGFGENLKLVINDYACNRKVYSVKAEGNTDASEIIVPTKTVLTEDFEGNSFPADGWTLKSQAAKTWYQGTEYGSKMAMCDLSKTEQQNEWLISPKVDLSAQTTTAGMVFDFYTNYYWSVQNHHHNLKVMATTNGTDWEQIWQLWDWNQKNEFGAWEKTQAKVTIPEKFQNEKSVQFAFVYEGKDSTSLWLDNVQVYVEDPSQIHTITAKAGEGGTIDPSGAVQITDGKSKTFTITPDTGRFISDVKVDGASVGTPTTYTFNKVTADHTIEVTFGGSDDAEQLIDEDFESGKMPSGWKLEQTNTTGYNGTWKVYKYYQQYGLYCSADEYDSDYSQSGAGQDERIIMSAQNLNGKTANFAFDFVANKTRLQNGKTVCTLEGSTDGGATWTTIWNAADVIAQMTNSSFSNYVQAATVSVPVPADMQKDGVLFSFHYVLPKNSTMGSIVFIDNLKLQADKSSSGGGTESTLLDENFDDCITSGYSGNIPSDWTQTKKNSSIYTWRTYKTSDHITAYCTNDSSSQSDGWGGDDEWGAGQDEYLITPELDLSNKTAKMSFQFSANRVNQIQETLSRNGTTFTLEASKDGTTWTPIWNAASIVDQLTETVVSSAYKTANVTVEIPAEFQAAGVKFAFRYQTKSGNTGGCTVLIDDVKLTASGGSSETPDEPTAFTITASAGQGGSISPNGAVSVKKGESQSFTITPSANYEIADVKVDGESVGKQTSYTFKNVTEAHTIAATFTEKAVTLPDSIHEDFNSGSLPEGWTVEGPSAKYNYESWKIDRYQDWRSDAAVCAANYMGNTAQNELLILPQINMQSSMQLSFDFAASYTQLSTGKLKLTVKASLDKGQNWTEIWNAQDHMGEIDEDNTPEDVTGKGSISIPANYCKAGAQFAFVFESAARTGASAAIDNVVFVAGDAPAPIERYGITIAAMEHGTVTADKSTAAAGETVTLTVTPDAGYHLKSLMAGDTALDKAPYTFQMPAKEVTVTALFEKDAEEPTTGTYKDGVYTGKAQGYAGTVTVTVTVENGKISKVEASGEKETPSRWQMAIAIIENLLGLGKDSDVDAVETIGGATISSAAIKAAVQDALKNAVAEDSGIFDSGVGTKQNPYVIATVDTLMDFAKSVNAGEDYQDKYIVLGSNLDLSEETWVPIGNSDHGKTNGFSGTFDGRGYTVSHVNCGSGSAAADYEVTGFFGVVDGTVRNLHISIDKYYNSHDADGQMISTGGLVGLLARGGVIDHCSVSGNSQVLSETSGPKAAVGGLVGQMQSGTLVANCWTDVGLSYGTFAVGVDADISMGGICGKQAQNSLIANSASFGAVPGMILTGKLRVGGLVGQASGAIYNCYTSSLTKANILGDASGNNKDATTAIGHLIGSSTAGAALYDCYYDKTADQFSNDDWAADPEEGKTERRQATGWDNGSEVKTDESFIAAKTPSELASDAFAAVLNGNTKNSIKNAASDYFKSKNLLTDTVSNWEDKLDDGFLSWKLTNDRVLFGDTEISTVEVSSVALLQALKVANGTKAEDLNLPEKVEVKLTTGDTKELAVSWACAEYDATKAGTYTFVGTLKLSGGVTNPKNLKAYVQVTVESGSNTGGNTGGGGSGGSGGSGSNTGNDKVLFPDVPKDAYYYDAVKWAVSKGVTNGTDNGMFGSDQPCTRAQIVTFLWRSAGSPAPKMSVNPFQDVKKGAYYYDAVLWAVEQGITTGVSQGEFAPDDTCTRGQSVTFLHRAKGAPAVSGSSFADVADDAYCAAAVKWAVKKGITNGTSSTTFSPDEDCTRAQIVTFLWRAAQNG